MTVIYHNKPVVEIKGITPNHLKVHSKNDCLGCGDIMSKDEQTPEIPGFCPVCVIKKLTNRLTPMEEK